MKPVLAEYAICPSSHAPSRHDGRLPDPLHEFTNVGDGNDNVVLPQTIEHNVEGTLDDRVDVDVDELLEFAFPAGKFSIVALAVVWMEGFGDCPTDIKDSLIVKDRELVAMSQFLKPFRAVVVRNQAQRQVGVKAAEAAEESSCPRKHPVVG